MNAVANVQRMASAGRRYPLTFVFAVYALPVVGGVLLGPFIALALDIAIGAPVEAFQSFLLLGVAGIVLTVATRVLVVAKRQGAVVVELDGDGIRELDDGVVRVSIPWSEARAAVKKSKARFRAAVFDYLELRFAAPNGEQIVITNHDEGGLFPGYHFRCLARRDLSLETQIAEQLPPIPEGAVDPRDRREHGSGVGRFFRSVTALIAGVSLAWFVLAVGVDRYANVPRTLPLLIRVMFMVLWSLPLVLQLPLKRRAPIVAIRAVLLSITVILPWVAGYVVTRQCEAKFADAPSYTCH